MRARELKRKTWLNNRNVKIFDLKFVNFKHFQKKQKKVLLYVYSDQSVGGITLQYLWVFFSNELRVVSRYNALWYFMSGSTVSLYRGG